MEELVKRISHLPDVFIRHQKQEEADLADTEREDVVRDLATNNVPVFLTRYGAYLKTDDCNIFDSSEDTFVQFMLQQIRTRKTNTKDKKNRRFTMMQKLIVDGSYFSYEKMREREPYLFDAMIGRFMDETDIRQLRPTVKREGGDGAWSTMLDNFADADEISQRRNVQQAEWEESSRSALGDHDHDHRSRFSAHVTNRMTEEKFQPEESDGDEEEDEMEKLQHEMERLSKMEADQYELGEDDTPEFLKTEFEDYMQQRFLHGKDKEFFDYSLCEDGRSSYNDPIKDREDEEKWFDED